MAARERPAGGSGALWGGGEEGTVWGPGRERPPAGSARRRSGAGRAPRGRQVAPSSRVTAPGGGGGGGPRVGPGRPRGRGRETAGGGAGAGPRRKPLCRLSQPLPKAPARGAAAPPQAPGVGPGRVPRPGARDRRPCPLRRGEGTSRAMPPCSRGEAARQPGPKAPAKGSLPLGTTALHPPPPTSLVTGGKVRLHGDALTRTLPSLAQRGVPEDRWLPFLVGREEANVGSFLKYGRRAEHQVQLSA